MAHITAGDITPIGQVEESTYGTTPVSPTYVGIEHIREGGSITPTDNPNPYVTWRYAYNGRRTFENLAYVDQQEDAGYNASVEISDLTNWYKVFDYAGIKYGNGQMATIPSRTAKFGLKQDSDSTEYALTYRGCKTDVLKISADTPAGVVKFDETVLASYRDPSETTFSFSYAGNAGVQWIGGVTLGPSGDIQTIYPQSFSITVKNNLARVRGYDSNLGRTVTKALLEGRQEIDIEITVWMEDFTNLIEWMSVDGMGGEYFTLKMGSNCPVTLNAYVFRNADGNNQPLIQDKQLQTLRFRANQIYYTLG